MQDLIIKQINLHSTAGGSDKIYVLTLQEFEGGYVVHFTYGKREVGPFSSAYKTVDPADKKKPKAVPLEVAEKIFAEVEHEKRTGKSKYHDLEDEAAPSQITPAPITQASQPNVDCMELTALLDAEAAIKFLRDPDFGAAEKHDGIRLLLHATSERVTAYNRTSGARAFPRVVEAEAKMLAGIVGEVIIDGELVGERYHAFDVLQLKGVDLRKKTLEQRQAVLESFFKPAKLKAISLVEMPFDEEGKIELLERLHRLKREGIVIKKRTSLYTAGRSKEWFKFKFVETASVIVLNHNQKRSVTMGLLHKGKLREVGNLSIPVNRQIPSTGSIIEVRYRKADPNSLNLIESVFKTVREDVRREDCTTSQLKFTTKAA